MIINFFSEGLTLFLEGKDEDLFFTFGRGRLWVFEFSN